MHARIAILAFIPLILEPAAISAGTATQTDWSGGDSIYGPVLDWGDLFYSDTDIECFSDPSVLAIQRTVLSVPIDHTVCGFFNNAWSVHTADINGDGYADIIGAAISDGVSWWENTDGSGTFWTEHTVDESLTGACSVFAVDINGDGYMDILCASYIENDIIWWENTDGSGTSWMEHTVDGDFSSVFSVHYSDINGDGYMDVLGAASSTDDITWWENTDGSGTSWVEHTIDASFNGAMSIYSIDMNGDGYTDVLGAASNADDIAWWENIDGSGTGWVEHTVDPDFDGAHSVYAADINGDGYMDILGAAYNCFDVAWWENTDSTGTNWVEHIIDEDFNCATCVRPADINGDGFMDVLGTADNYEDDISWWENTDGSGTSWSEHIVDSAFDGASSVHASDVNGDGYIDMVGSAVYTDEVAWWDLTAFLPCGSLESSVLDTQESPDWQTIEWNCSTPSGTGVGIQVRASGNSASMGAWSDTLISPCSLQGILSDEDRYFQYRIILTTTDSLSTPVFHDVTVEWVPITGTHEASAGEITPFGLYGARPNPAMGRATIVFSLPVDSEVELYVYDLTGRVVLLIDGEYRNGVHEVLLDDLASGVYLVRMASEEFAAARQFVVIDQRM